MSWPLAHAQDDGLRPGGDPDKCFYCNQKIGDPHTQDCVIVTKLVLLRIETVDHDVTGIWEHNVPWSWDPEMINFMYNEGSWCASNIFAEDRVTWDQSNAEEHLKELTRSGCLCDKIRFDFARVLDDTPRRKLKQ
jgi:hypothetical protein